MLSGMNKNLSHDDAYASPSKKSFRPKEGISNLSTAQSEAWESDCKSAEKHFGHKSSGLGRIFIAKNRAGRDGILFPMRMDTARSKILVVDSDDEMTLSEALRSDNNDMKTILKNKWNEINSTS